LTTLPFHAPSIIPNCVSAALFESNINELKASAVVLNLKSADEDVFKISNSLDGSSDPIPV